MSNIGQIKKIIFRSKTYNINIRYLHRFNCNSLNLKHLNTFEYMDELYYQSK